MDGLTSSLVPSEVEGRCSTSGENAAKQRAQPLALYVHWPFCVSKCPYCDFNSHVRASVDQESWRAALLQDMAHEAEQQPGGPLTSIFFGGGTPSLMPPETVAALIAAAERHWGFAPGHRDHTRGQSLVCRGRPLCRSGPRRRQSRLPRPAIIGR
jgi:coproporphyrinogen III oxidase-like Fe-S oxidoreductase